MQLLNDENKIDWLRWRSQTKKMYFHPDIRVSERDFGDGRFYYYEMSGDVIYPEKVLMLSEHITRVDFKLDVLFNKLEARSFWRTAENMIKGLKVSKKIESTGKTVYFGSGNGIKVRIYEKGKQLDAINEFKRWVRLEFEMNSKPLKRLLATYDTWEEIRNHLLHVYTYISQENILGQKPVIKSLEDVEIENKVDRLDVIMAELENSGRTSEMLERLASKLGYDLVLNGGNGVSRVIN